MMMATGATDDSDAVTAKPFCRKGRPLQHTRCARNQAR